MKKILTLLVVSMLSTCSFAPMPVAAATKFPLSAEIIVKLCQNGLDNNGKVFVVKGSAGDKKFTEELKGASCVVTNRFKKDGVIEDDSRLAEANYVCDRVAFAISDKYPASEAVVTCIFE
jgi:hypothetical protein